MEQNDWLVISYTLPREPSRARVSVWRKLKKCGAINIQQSVWLLPFRDNYLEIFDKIKEDVASNNGDALVMKTNFFHDKDMKKIVGLFNQARDEEYNEFIGKCTDFFNEINKETNNGNFSFAEIEENEEEIEKLNKWFNKILVRDFFNAPLKEQSKEMLNKCKDMLDEFCNEVYRINDKS